MKKITYVSGQYSQLELDDKSRIFLEALPEKVTIRRMIFGIIPTRILWEFSFSFYIRTTTESWKSSEMILELVVDTIKNANNIEDLKNILQNKTNKALREYIKNQSETARDVSVDKVGIHAIKQMLNPKELSNIEKIVHKFGKIIEETSKDIPSKYPAMVFPQSLLPYPKKDIKRALEQALQYTEDTKLKENMKTCLYLLGNFINDKEANKRNSKILKNLFND